MLEYNSKDKSLIKISEQQNLMFYPEDNIVVGNPPTEKIPLNILANEVVDN